jgi:hypothetical protein
VLDMHALACGESLVVSYMVNHSSKSRSVSLCLLAVLWLYF